MIGPAAVCLVLATVAGWVAGGPVAAGAVAAYTAAALLALRRQRRRRRAQARRSALVDAIDAAAAELRAGLPPATALAEALGTSEAVSGVTSDVPGGAAPVPPGAGPEAGTGPAEGVQVGDGTDALRARIAAVVRLTDRTGAPLADLLDRIAAEARAAERVRTAASAHAAGAYATAWLLTGLPVAGVLLGYAIGAAPLEILLDTPLGAACTAGAVALQLSGLAWAGRIARAPTAVAS